ncbi:magnesium transporter MgtE [Lapidilactobacillus concavus DSM 17758]|uniref:Magnesium transporter MgtE n=1 Tax=Lapidilactobacillus concavus DSM 17758 TaxID=1423735 RepID=A0A0R1VPY5_9LACO|nr:magnesium transporter [Lapidilactobacillus concavus]KRM07799.1 magnesium transporter MgtE [Lapidilactobacillus concavus DSM 17758]GEL13604.1 magnesium transporter MgtE [Lapidilactobacillus concavus]
MEKQKSQLEVTHAELLQALANNETKVFRKRFLDMHFYDQAHFYLSLEPDQRKQLYRVLNAHEVGDFFDTIEDDLPEMTELLAEMDTQYAANMLNDMFDDNAADILEHLPKEDVDRYLSLMNRSDAIKLRKLLHYDTETAGGIMTTDYVSVLEDLDVGQALAELKRVAADAETIYYVYVVNSDNLLVGVLTLRDLLVHDSHTKLAEIMTPNAITASVHDEQAEVAQKIRDYDFIALPVVDDQQKLVGIITVDDAIEVIDDEAQSDYSGLAGVDVDYVSENPFKAASKRLPWLITLLFLGMLTATLINHYEALLSTASILAVFISLITGTAGNAGTQSLAVAVRRLAVNGDNKPKIWRLVLSEVLTGLVTGVITGLTVMLIVGIWKQNLILGVTIGLAMAAAITVANLAGSLIPMLMEKIGFDPAVASGPFITTLSDLTSVLIYFSIAQFFLNAFLN